MAAAPLFVQLALGPGGDQNQKGSASSKSAIRPAICNSTHMLWRGSFFAVDRVNFPANNPEASLLRNRRYLSVKGFALGAEIDDASTGSTSSFTQLARVFPIYRIE